MEFCPKCGAVLIQKRKNFGCPRCGYSSKDKVKIVSSEKINERKEIGVVTGKDTETLPIVAENAKNVEMKKLISGQFKHVQETKQKQNSSNVQSVNTSGESTGDNNQTIPINYLCLSREYR